MASERDHLAKAAHNEKFLQTIDEEFVDWQAIVAFYAAVHHVEALFATKKQDSRGHRERNQSLKREYPAIYREFYPLYNYSLFVRYDCGRLSRKHVEEELIRKRLPALKQAIARHRR